jgi:hypothetical protein
MKVCTRCSMGHDMGGQLCFRCCEERAQAVYWDRAPACRAKGPDKAECLLEVGHAGDHQGNGFDAWGPLSRRWKP